MKIKGFLKELAREKKMLSEKLAQVERVYAALTGHGPHAMATKAKKKRNKMSKKGREAIATAQRARWAKIKAAKKK